MAASRELPDSSVPSHCAVATASYWLQDLETAFRPSSRDCPLGRAAAQVDAEAGSSSAHCPARLPAEEARFFSMPSGGEAISVESWLLAASGLSRAKAGKTAANARARSVPERLSA